MPKPQCLIDIDLANALNQFLYKAGMHKDAYKELGFLCPACQKPVRPHRSKVKTGPRPHFEHVDKSSCEGPPSWELKKKKKS